MDINELFELLNLSNYDEDDPRLLPYTDKLNKLWANHIKYNYKGNTYYIPRCYYDCPEEYIKEKYNID